MRDLILLLMMLTRYATRCSSASLVKEKHESVRHQPLTAEEAGLKRMLGPCLEQHVEHGSFVSKLMTGTAVEVKVHGGWQPGVVKRLRFDGETLLRFVKVSSIPYIIDCFISSVGCLTAAVLVYQYNRMLCFRESRANLCCCACLS
jgi:hypothetical protein